MSNTTATLRRYSRAIDAIELHGAYQVPPRQLGESREDARRRIAAALFAVWRAQRRREPTG